VVGSTATIVRFGGGGRRAIDLGAKKEEARQPAPEL